MKKFLEKLGFHKISKVTFFSASIILLLLAILMLVLREQLKEGLSSTTASIGFYFAWFFIIIALLALIFVLAVSLSKLGKIRLATPGEKYKKEYSNFAWAAMIFAGGIGAGILWGGLSEWQAYLKYDYLLDMPTRNNEAIVPEAVAVASAYSIFHWGPLPWAMHAAAAIPIAYMYYVKKTPILKISQACGSLLGKQKDKLLGKTIDTFFILGLTMACSTSLGLGTQTVSQLFSEVAGTDPNDKVQQIIVLVIVYAVFVATAVFGLKKGMALLARANAWLTFFILAFVLFAGPILFIIKNGIATFGNFIFYFPKMITFTDATTPNGPVPSDDFVANWTTFFWAWWGAYVLFMGMFIAKISKGRTIRQMVLGTLGFGTLGVFMVFAILGGAGIGFALGSGVEAHPNVFDIGSTFEVAATVLSYLPAPNFIISLVFISATIYMSNSFNGAAFSMAASSMKEIGQDEAPPNWLKLFFSFLTALIPLGMIMVGADLSIITAFTVIGGIPSLILLVLMVCSWLKTVRKDNREGYLDPWFAEKWEEEKIENPKKVAKILSRFNTKKGAK